ncbi:hypothetical protein [Sphaerisporangium aureirubrum]|uniref:Uncharacterized protein n=1 Tax=Sphaerisporangium aureirubrum TaxID=1544736 RepID=A0ABW1NW48_9ACTN
MACIGTRRPPNVPRGAPPGQSPSPGGPCGPELSWNGLLGPSGAVGEAATVRSFEAPPGPRRPDGARAVVLRQYATVSWHVVGRLDSLRREVTLTPGLDPAVRGGTMLDLTAVRRQVCAPEGFDEDEIRARLDRVAALVAQEPSLSAKVAGLVAELIGGGLDIREPVGPARRG